jgi:putative oxidoreductase
MIQRVKDKLLDLGLLALRLAAGGFMLFGHGIGKLANYSEMSTKFPDPIGFLGSEMSLVLAIFAELGCSALVMAGLFTRLAALPLCATMFVAGFLVHGGDPWAKKELALVYLAMFLFLALSGGGSFSIDAVIRRKRSAAAAA